jgi:ketosteroid isomerase-like protein
MNPNKSVVEKFIAALGKGEGQVLGTLMTQDFAATCTGTSLVSGTRSYSDLPASSSN